jgi:hypothetical protein
MTAIILVRDASSELDLCRHHTAVGALDDQVETFEQRSEQRAVARDCRP